MVERRLTWLALIIALWGAGILGKLVSLQAIHHREYAGRARSIQQVVVEIPAPRGTIFDRNGQPLAMSLSLVCLDQLAPAADAIESALQDHVADARAFGNFHLLGMTRFALASRRREHAFTL